MKTIIKQLFNKTWQIIYMYAMYLYIMVLFVVIPLIYADLNGMFFSVTVKNLQE